MTNALKWFDGVVQAAVDATQLKKKLRPAHLKVKFKRDRNIYLITDPRSISQYAVDELETPLRGVCRKLVAVTELRCSLGTCEIMQRKLRIPLTCAFGLTNINRIFTIASATCT